MMTYSALRQEGVRLLEQMTGGRWTDFNAHDPGITLLEVLCYALSDLGYRTEHEIQDLLADGGADPYASLHPAASVFPSRAVTLADLRRLILDIDGVQNAWIEPSRAAPEGLAEALVGLFSVRIETSGTRDGTAVRADVARVLYANRGLCEDFSEITVLRGKPIAVKATVEIGRVADPNGLLDEILDALDDTLSPRIAAQTPEELFAAGKAVEDIFEGPLPERGFLSDAALARASRKVAVHGSDLVHAILDVEGARAVTGLLMSSGGASDAWSLPLERDECARLDRVNSQITLRSAGVVVAAKSAGVEPSRYRRPVIDALVSFKPPAATSRDVATYTSIQRHLPALYGVGELGLPESASPARKAQAKQLKAYLLIFDQLMANYLAQLAHARELFSHDPAPHGASEKSYFAQPVEGAGLGLEAIRTLSDAAFRELTERADPTLDRKNRFLDHLLARFAESLNDRYAASGAADPDANEKLVRDKQAFLQNYPKLSAARGAAYDTFAFRFGESRSGLEDRVRLKLGLVASSGENVIIVEHILLRPKVIELSLPTLEAYLGADPKRYASKLTFVFPGAAGRFARDDFRLLVEQTVRAQTPAHLAPYVAWLDAADWQRFSSEYLSWWRQRREMVAERYSVMLGIDPTLPATLKGFPLLPTGTSAVRGDADGLAPRLVDYGASVTAWLETSQGRGTLYSLVQNNVGGAVISAASVVGTGKGIQITSKPVSEDIELRVKAERSGFEPIVLDVSMPLKVRANPALAVRPFESAFVPFNASGAVTISGSQGSVTYSAYRRVLDDADFFVPATQSALVVAGAPDVRVKPPPSLLAWNQAGFSLASALVAGNGGALLLSIGAVSADCVVIVRACKTHAASPSYTSDVQIAQAVVLLARPDLVPGLKLERVGDRVLVTGGQQGVFYYFYDVETGTQLGKPVYFHRRDGVLQLRNRGIGRLRLGRDFAVARGPITGDRAAAQPLAPMADLNPFPATKKVKVLAVFARTGVAWAQMQVKDIVG